MLSYFNQWRFVIDAYEKLYALFTKLNNADDKKKGNNLLTEFDLKSTEFDFEFRNYSYLFVVSLKSLLDSFTCLVDIIQNQVPRKDFYPDFFGYGRKTKLENPITEIDKVFKKLKRNTKGNWISNLTRLRNNIIHGGYLLRPKIGFKKSAVLIMQPYKGNDYYSAKTVDIGNLFENFISKMPKIENKFAEIFTSHKNILPHGITHESTFKYADSMTHFFSKQIKVIDEE